MTLTRLRMLEVQMNMVLSESKPGYKHGQDYAQNASIALVCI